MRGMQRSLPSGASPVVLHFTHVSEVANSRVLSGLSRAVILGSWRCGSQDFFLVPNRNGFVGHRTAAYAVGRYWRIHGTIQGADSRTSERA